MKPTQTTRPVFPSGYVDRPTAEVPWEYVEQQLTDAIHYWMCSVRPDNRPHVVPRWAVYVEGRIYYDGSPETRHARNVTENPHVALHLESGEKALIAEGTCRAAGKPVPELAEKIAAAYRAKYAALGYAPEPTQWDEGGLYEFTPRKVLAWTKFNEDPTKFILK
jgi:nitroimidazol reductase NimA-like FMN-containing flavoprotein (pyridoxamine 5'-phosphate oxidase superfamily)